MHGDEIQSEQVRAKKEKKSSQNAPNPNLKPVKGTCVHGDDIQKKYSFRVLKRPESPPHVELPGHRRRIGKKLVSKRTKRNGQCES